MLRRRRGDGSILRARSSPGDALRPSLVSAVGRTERLAGLPGGSSRSQRRLLGPDRTARSDDAGLLTTLAVARVRSGRSEQGISLSTEATLIDPRRATAWVERARGGLQELSQALDRRRLAGPNRAEEAVQAPGRNGEVDAVHGREVSETAAQAAGLYDVFRGGPRLHGRRGSAESGRTRPASREFIGRAAQRAVRSRAHASVVTPWSGRFGSSAWPQERGSIPCWLTTRSPPPRGAPAPVRRRPLTLRGEPRRPPACRRAPK